MNQNTPYQTPINKTNKMGELSQYSTAVGSASPPTYHTLASRMELLNAAFGYQKEALELRHRYHLNHLTKWHKMRRMARMVARRNAPAIQEIETLKQENTSLRDQAHMLETELETTKTQLHEAEAKSTELLQLTIKLAYYRLHGQSIPSDVMCKCHQEINDTGKWSVPAKIQHDIVMTQRINRA